MSFLKLTIKFIEPYRVVQWYTRKQRNSIPFLRGYGFARWHCLKNSPPDNTVGRPYITGTLVRSAIIKAAEELLFLNSGEIDNIDPCCKGEFKGNRAWVVKPGEDEREVLKRRRYRRRPTLTWESTADCKPDHPCPFCLLLGRYEKSRHTDLYGNDAETNQVNFENFNVLDRKPVSLEAIADARIVNRVDQYTGKAQDFFNIWEMPEGVFDTFQGNIRLAGNALRDKANGLEQLIRNAAAFTDKISGSLCYITVDTDPAPQITTFQSPCKDRPQATTVVKSVKTDPFQNDLDKIAHVIADAFEKQDKLVHLRLFSDVVRELRRYDQKQIANLPKGHIDRLGKPSKHFIWDIEIAANLSLADGFDEKHQQVFKQARKLRDWLPRVIKAFLSEYQQGADNYQRAYERIGEALYSLAKKKAPEQFSSDRPLGTSQAMKIAEPNKLTLVKAHDGPRHEFLICGDWVAQTPFYFGDSDTAEVDGAHTSLRLLRTRDGIPRLARSAVRGILRRDLRIVFGTGCRAELAAKTICACPVCQLMSKITIKDSQAANYTQAPQIRHRIRLDHHKGIVDKGALFDMEIGPGGVRFPFELRLRSSVNTIPPALETVLEWWSTGRAFLSGEAGTGKGRFCLINMNVYKWDLENDYELYQDTCGGRKHKPSGNWVTAQFKAEENYPWQAFKVVFNMRTPFITKDPIASLIESSDDDAIGMDALSYKTVAVDPDGNPKETYLLKGESLRGILRTAVGRRCRDQEDSPLLEKEHEECTCVLCRLFGNEHEAGKVRVEDLEITSDVQEWLIDRVAIDRFTGGARDQFKFDLKALVSKSKAPLRFEGAIWFHQDLKMDECALLELALQDIHDGLYALGGLGNVGFGWLNYLKTPDSEPDKTVSSESQNTIALKLNASNLSMDSLNLNESEIHWPHYFLPFGPKVKRINTPPSHTHFHPERHSGKLVCRLHIKTPVIIPDAHVKSEKDKHKTYDFFNLNGELAIPGSEIKGMVSSVFEALTNSCLRVFNEKKRLSWRMEADKDILAKFKPGQVQVSENEYLVEEMDEIRYPFYDRYTPDEKRQKEYFNWEGETKPYYTHPTDQDKVMLNLVGPNRQNITVDHSCQYFSKTNKYKIIKNREKAREKDSFMFLATPFENRTGYQFNLCDEKPRIGYLKITGPNKIEKEKGCLQNLPSVPQCWASIEHNSIKPGKNTVPCVAEVDKKEQCKKFEKNGDEIECRRDTDGECIRNKLEPEFLCAQIDQRDPSKSFTYIMTKRCERVFLKKTDGEIEPILIQKQAIEKYEMLIQEYQKNAEHYKTPKAFQTILPKNETLNDGDLVYFRTDDAENEVIEIIPVRISRFVDDNMLAHESKLSRNLRPCVHEILDQKQAQSIKSTGVKELFEHHPDGLCPACALFGTTYYKGRAAFGFAFGAQAPLRLFTDENLKPDDNGDKTRITLPLLERPRPTWSMPNKASRVPGRKFFVHHQGWKKVIANTPKESPNENNKTVQALDRDQSLDFEIRFENLDDAELGLLIYALQLEAGLAHKLGMGKALGFGSVSIEVKAIHNQAGKALKPDKVIEEAKKELRKIWEVETDEALAQKLEDFFKLLIYIESDAIEVRYPKLRKEDDELEEKPGYMELKESAYNPETRTKDLTEAWKSWV